MIRSNPTAANLGEIQAVPARAHVVVASYAPVKQRISSGGRHGCRLYLSVICPRRSHNRRLVSFGSSWLTQRTQLRFAHHEAIKARREALYAEFIEETARLYGDALGHQKDELADLVKIYALTGRIRLVSPRPGVSAAERTLDIISQTYLAPNRTLHEVMDDFHLGRSDFFAEFGEAWRQDLGLD